jgi:hypothetical protein
LFVSRDEYQLLKAAFRDHYKPRGRLRILGHTV